ncbi:fimbria/pilus periplasmic chaperone [Photobacterium frigidiphilum]|uniref:fimbrial biogenesis chaperone n=1 Tax=Photobacterium frigidiphilum TaxID=264736 RepID=UPI003D1362D6
MNRLVIMAVFLMSSVLLVSNAQAAFTLNATRVVYIEGTKGANLVIKNNNEKKYGGQVWLESEADAIPDNSFVISPSLFTLASNSKQNLRIMQTSANLPIDREALFWLYVQELPPALEEANQLQFAMRTKIKLIARPANLVEAREGAESQLTITAVGNTLKINNPTPYIFAISSLMKGKAEFKDEALSLVKPKRAFTIANNMEFSRGDQVIVTYVDDFGAYKQQILKVK